jgi:uncharacterized protein YcgL (UPF0745 family)
MAGFKGISGYGCVLFRKNPKKKQYFRFVIKDNLSDAYKMVMKAFNDPEILTIQFRLKDIEIEEDEQECKDRFFLLLKDPGKVFF